MNIVNDSWLVSAAPVEVLLGLGIFFAVAAAVLLALSMEAGRYPECTARYRAFRTRNPWARRARRWRYCCAPFGRSMVFDAGGNRR